jgi:hypothetical protein
MADVTDDGIAEAEKQVEELARKHAALEAKRRADDRSLEPGMSWMRRVTG